MNLCLCRNERTQTWKTRWWSEWYRNGRQFSERIFEEKQPWYNYCRCQILIHEYSRIGLNFIGIVEKYRFTADKFWLERRWNDYAGQGPRRMRKLLGFCDGGNFLEWTDQKIPRHKNCRFGRGVFAPMWHRKFWLWRRKRCYRFSFGNI